MTTRLRRSILRGLQLHNRLRTALRRARLRLRPGANVAQFHLGERAQARRHGPGRGERGHHQPGTALPRPPPRAGAVGARADGAAELPDQPPAEPGDPELRDDALHGGGQRDAPLS